MMKAFHARSSVFGLLLGVGLSVGVALSARGYRATPIEQPSWQIVVSGDTQNIMRFIDEQNARRPAMTLSRFTADSSRGEVSFWLPSVELNAGKELIRLQQDALALHLSYGFRSQDGVPSRGPGPKAV